MRIIIYGAGKNAKKIAEMLKYDELQIEIVAIYDREEKLWGGVIGTSNIYSPDQIGEINYDFWVNSIGNYSQEKQISEWLINDKGLPISKKMNYLNLFIIVCQKLKYNINDESIPQNGERTIVIESENGFILGGVESWVRDISLELHCRNNDVRVLTDDSVYIVSEEQRSILVPIVKHDAKWDIACAKEIMRFLISNRPFFFISNAPNLSFLVACSLKNNAENRIVVVVHNEHDSIIHNYVCCDNYIYRYAVVSIKIRNKLVDIGVNPEKIDVITLPISSKEVFKRTYETRSGRPIRIGYAGRIEITQKRIDNILLFAKKLFLVNSNFVLNIVGDGTAVDYMTEFILSEGLDKQVKYLGCIERTGITEFWQNNDVAINLSDYEGHSLSQMEAMVNGTIPVVTDVSGARDDILDGINGFIIPLGDIDKAVCAVDYIENHRQLLNSFGMKARQAVFEKAKMETHIDYWMELIKR